MSTGALTVQNPTTGEVVNWMCKLAWQAHKAPDLIVRHLAEDITRDLQSGDYASEALAVLDWVFRNIRYVRDMRGSEFVRWPKETLDTIQGDCDDMSVLIAALLLSIGAAVDFVIASFTASGIPSHVFAAVRTKYGRIVLDPVANVETRKMLRDMTAFAIIPVESGVEDLPTPVDNIPFAGWSGYAGPSASTVAVRTRMGAIPRGTTIYSVPMRDGYRYVAAMGDFPPTGRYRQPHGSPIKGFWPPEAFAAPLRGGTVVGEGSEARGMIAVPPAPAGALGSVSAVRSWVDDHPVATLALAGAVAYGLWRRR
jgi:hypothetical protein